MSAQDRNTAMEKRKNVLRLCRLHVGAAWGMKQHETTHLSPLQRLSQARDVRKTNDCHSVHSCKVSLKGDSNSRELWL